RGPYVRSRIADLSIGTAKALNFYGHGLARVRVEYVGRAPLDGSDDRMLLATLREGAPAPAPSKVMIASAKPFLPASSDASGPAVASQRPLAVGGPSVRPREPTSVAEVVSSSRTQPRGKPSPSSLRTEASAASTPAAAFEPRSDAPSLGLISGRGLY